MLSIILKLKTKRSDGQAQIPTTVPDTITSWIASAFATNNVSGLGIADTTTKVDLKIFFFYVAPK